MSKKRKRQKDIIALLSGQPTLRISEIADQLRVTTETIRRDFRELTEAGLIDRMYGGALLRQGPETNVTQRNDLLIEERKRIARTLIGGLGDAQTLMIGSGATTVHAARQIAAVCQDLTVIVHSVDVMSALAANPSFTIIMIPGVVHIGEFALHGSQTTEFIERYHADVCILGASGVDLKGATDALLEGGDVYRTMVRCSEKAIILADASKFYRHFPARFAQWSDVDLLITDRMPDDRLRDAIAAGRAELIVASEASPLETDADYIVQSGDGFSTKRRPEFC